jgi:hypothetical protein
MKVKREAMKRMPVQFESARFSSLPSDPLSLLFSRRPAIGRERSGEEASCMSVRFQLKGGLKRRQRERPFSSELFDRETRSTRNALTPHARKKANRRTTTDEEQKECD